MTKVRVTVDRYGRKWFRGFELDDSGNLWLTTEFGRYSPAHISWYFIKSGRKF